MGDDQVLTSISKCMHEPSLGISSVGAMCYHQNDRKCPLCQNIKGDNSKLLEPVSKKLYISGRERHQMSPIYVVQKLISQLLVYKEGI